MLGEELKPADCKPAHTGANPVHASMGRDEVVSFDGCRQVPDDSYHADAVRLALPALALSSNGQDSWFSSSRSEFDSLWGHMPG